MTACFFGNLRHSARMASTTTILKLSEMSERKVEICFIRRSMLDSLPVFNSVVMARVATLRFWSAIRFSMSRFTVLSELGCVMATLLSVRTAANRSVGRGDERNSCSTETAGPRSRAEMSLMLTMARAASYMTISLLLRRQDSRNSKRLRSDGSPSAASTLLA